MRRLSQYAILALVALCASIAWGQATTSLRGTVTDPSGSAIRGARVTLINSSTNFTRETQTGADGGYLFVEVLPGTYLLRVEAQGFSKYEEAGVVLQVELPATVDVKMKVGTIAEVVSVTAQAQSLNTTDASVGNTMGTNEIENLPLDHENTVLLLSFQPGVTLTSDNETYLTGIYDTRAGMVNGERSDQNNISLDGVSNNAEFAGYAFDGILPTTPFSVEEFRVTTSNYDASQGRSSGAQIAMVTKGGTNQFHGSLYEFNRNGLGEANDWFLKESQLSATLPNKPTQLVWNNYGGTIGGPILKNRLFFFFNYEGHRQNVGASIEQVVPSTLLQDGIIQYQCADAAACTGMEVTGASGTSYPIQAGNYALGPTQLASMDPLGIGPSQGALAYFHTYLTPNDPNFGDPPNFEGYRFAAPTTTRENWMIGRLDYKITQNGNHSLFFRGTGVDEHYGNAPFLPGRPPETKSSSVAKGFVAGYTSVWGPRLVNNFRYGLTRDSSATSGDSNQPWVEMRDLGQDIAYSYGDTSPVHNIVDTVDWTKGSHSLQFGTNFLLSRLYTYNYGAVFSNALTNSDWVSPGGFANLDSPLNPACIALGGSSCTAADTFPAVSPGFAHNYDFPLAALMGLESEVDGVYNYDVSRTQGTAHPQNLPILRHWSVDDYNFFFQDTWKVKRNLSFTYGLNYQLMTPMTETAGQEVAPTINMGTWFNERRTAMLAGVPENQVNGGAPVGFSPAGSPYGQPGLYGTQTKNFAPRLGIAFSPHADSGFLNKLFGRDQTSIRAGFGMYYQNFGPELAQYYSAMGEYGLSTVVNNPAQDVTVATSPRLGNTLADMNSIPLSFLGTCCTPSLIPPATISFPQVPQPALAITDGVDQSLKTPYSYALDLSVQRQLPGKMTLDVAYVGHLAHRLLALDDIAAPANLVDPKSGITYYQAARQLSTLARQNTPDSAISASTIGPTAAYWQNMMNPGSGTYTLCSTGATTNNMLAAIYDDFGPGCFLYNETTAIYLIDVYGFPVTPQGGLFSYYDSQYSSLWTWRSIAWSNYNALQVTLGKQMSHGLMFRLNYTYAKAMDVESMAERGAQYLTDSVINPWSPRQMYGPSDSDLRHQINGYWIYQLPFGKGRAFAGNTSKLADAFIGGWQIGGTTRWTSGFPFSVYMSEADFPTNWDEMGWADLTGSPIGYGTTHSSATNGIPPGTVNVFKNPNCVSTNSAPCAENAFGFAYPGESGVRNPIRGDGFTSTDMNLSKRWKITEGQSFELRWSVFNAFNNTKFDIYTMQDQWAAQSTFGNYTQTLTQPRRMEFAGIYRF